MCVGKYLQGKKWERTDREREREREGRRGEGR